MLITTLTDCECFGLVSTTVIYHLFGWFFTSQAVKERFILIAIILLELWAVYLVSKPSSQRFYSGKNYRPQASYSLVLIFLVPLCVLKDSASSKWNFDIQEGKDVLWISVVHVSVITSKFASLHGTYAFFTYGCTVFIFLCLLTHLSSLTCIVYCIVSVVIIWKSIDFIPSSAPKSFTFGELAIILQLLCGWMGRVSKNIYHQVTLNENDKYKWTGSTIVAAVILATVVMGITKGYRSILGYIFIYAVHGVCSVAFLTWMFKENFLLWLFHQFFRDCIGMTLLISWILVFAVAIIWTVSQALVIDSLKVKDPNEKHRTRPPSAILSPSTHIIDDKFSDVPAWENNVTDKRPFSTNVSESFITYNTRKVFHFFILLVYVPGLLLDPRILFLSSCAAFGVFIIFEASRVLQVPYVGQLTDKILRPFTDERDQGPIFLTHIYLLVGLSLPLWITSLSFNGLSSPIRLYSGVLALGVGDTVACVAGRAFGKHKWPGTKKTVEGSIGAIAAQMMFVFFLNSLDLLPIHNAFNLWMGVTVTFLVEAFTDQIDNLVLPLVLFPFLC